MKTNYIYLLIVLLLLSCSKDNDVEPIVIKERTILAYVALDNDLSNEMDRMYASLMEGWGDTQNDGSLVVFADRLGSRTPVLINIKKNKGKIVSDTVRVYENDNSASPKLLRQVIADTKLIAPAKSYGLILFSHANGWLPKGVYPDPLEWERNASNKRITARSIFEDRGRKMELADFAAAIPDGAFEFIASEMCFMSSVETAYALRNKTKYLLASAPEVLSPGFEPIYKNSLYLLYKPTPDLKEFGRRFYKYFSELPDESNRGEDSAAISLVKTSEIEALAMLTQKINPQLTQDEIDQVQYFDRIGKPHLFFDFADYIRQVATPEQMAEIEEQLDKVVIFKRNTAKLININIVRHSGLSVYIPQESLPRLNEAYEETEWYRRVKN